MIHIKIITPIVSDEIYTDDNFAQFVSPQIQFSYCNIDVGPASIECEYDESFAVPDVIKKSVEAEASGASAIVIDCFGDPGLRQAREAVSIPVFGPGQSSMHMAAQLGQKFSVVTILDSVCPLVENAATLYGVDKKLASVRAVGIPVLDLGSNEERLRQSLASEALKAVQDDGAHVIVLGCTGMIGCAKEVSASLMKSVGVHIPVIDPVHTAVATAIAACQLNLTTSGRTYPVPSRKKLTGFEWMKLS